MIKSYQSVTVPLYRWSFKNFGQGSSLPQFRSMFNINFLLIVLLANAMLFTKLIIKTEWITLNVYTCLAMVSGAVFFLIVNHFILLNNRWLKTINAHLAKISRHNINPLSVMLLVNVIFACCICLIR